VPDLTLFIVGHLALHFKVHIQTDMLCVVEDTDNRVSQLWANTFRLAGLEGQGYSPELGLAHV
jgi:hypothetical protein